MSELQRITAYVKGFHKDYREKLWAAFLWREQRKAEGYKRLWLAAQKS